MSDIGNLSGLGSVAQAARVKQLKTVRAILIVIGVLTIVVNCIDIGMMKSAVNESLQKEVQALRAKGMVEDRAQVEKIKNDAITLGYMLDGIAIGLGVLFIIFSMLVRKYPVPITILSLVLYVGSAAVFGLIVPMMLLQGIIFKIIVIVAFVKSIQAALAYQRENNLQMELDVTPT
jgi:hypothetical protein